MHLTVDIGNTTNKAGIFDGEELLWAGVLAGELPSALDGLPYNQKIRRAIFCSVKMDEQSLKGALSSRFEVFVLTHELPLPFEVRYDTPETLGPDRLAAAAGAMALFPRTDCLVIDAGTCITMDVITREGVFVGGNISPGIRMRLAAMHTFTARLPALEPDWTYWDALLGNSTQRAMQQGAVWGALLEVQGAIDALCKRWPKLQVLITGGDAPFFVENLKTKIFAHPNLVLIGLNKILTYNVENSAS